MRKYIDTEKLYEYLEQVSEFYPRYADNFLDNAVINVINGIKTFITSLQQEQPNKYETALEKARKWMPNVNQGGHAILIDIFPELGEGLDPRYGGRKQEQPEVDNQ